MIDPIDNRTWLLTLARDASELVGLASYLNSRARAADEYLRDRNRHTPGSVAHAAAQMRYSAIIDEVHKLQQELEAHVRSKLATHTCYRVYPSGDRSPSIVMSTHEMLEWRTYNETLRFGCAQYVDGKCVYPGSLSVEEAKKHEITL